MIKLPASRTILSIILLLLFFVFLVGILFVTNLSFSVWEQLQQKPSWLIWTYLVIIFCIFLVFGRIIGHFLWPKKNRLLKEKKNKVVNNISATTQRLEDIGLSITSDTPNNKQDDTASTQKNNQSHSSPNLLENSDELLDKWEHDFESSAELMAIKAELSDYEQRKSQKILYLSLFGDISCGKSSVIKALIAVNSDVEQKEEIETNVMGGTTREIIHYHWSIKDNDSEYPIILTDMPGLNEQFALLDMMSTEEMQRAHIVIYLCDGDLTATQFEELKALLLLKKPCLVALNKADRYHQEELLLLIERIKKRLSEIDSEQTVPVCTISAGAMREYIRVTPDGDEQRVQRPIAPDVQSLYEQLVNMMHIYNVDELELLREKSVAQMVNNKLDQVEAAHKRTQSLNMVSSYTKKAVVASMATISPGTDILVQGYLGIQMIKDLCKIYDAQATDIDANKLLELIKSRMDKTLPLLLAIAGNGLKAFPGIGTVSGGLMHAVAYGMIFDTLGHSVARTLEVTGELSPVLISDLYEEQLSENIESRTKDFIKLALKLRNSDK
ncbi:MAG: GTPase domain-containing protein [Gammaproteobacteria bacterium]|nr:GTPase domain-containing protein [Gammaproteobacteria bacterium]